VRSISPGLEFTLKGWDASEQSPALPEREGGPEPERKKEKEKAGCGRPHLLSVAHCPFLAAGRLLRVSKPGPGPAIHQATISLQNPVLSTLPVWGGVT
jgi:hypothetical protein